MSSGVESQQLLAWEDARDADVTIGPLSAGSTAPSEGAKIPRTVVYIIGNEFCERFSFYGMRAILGLYLMEKLKMTESDATELVHLFIVAAYLFPLPGAFISDSFLGKYRVILYLSTVYCVGNWLLSLSAAVVDTSAGMAYNWCILGLLFITLGSGGIKPCVSSFGGDQIELTNPPGPARDRLLRWFFSYFYFAINVGSTLSTIIVPIMRAQLSYSAAFATPAVLMVVALFIFWMGRSLYAHQPPSGNVVAQVLSVVWCALFAHNPTPHPSSTTTMPPQQRAAKPSLPAVTEGHQVTVPDAPTPQDDRPAEEGSSEDPLVLRKLHKRGSKRAVLPAGHVAAPHWLDRAKGRFGEERVEDVKQLLRVLWLFLPTPIFWSLYDQQASRWTFQATRMNGELPFGITLLPDQMQTLNAVGILVMIPLFDQVLYPLAERVGLSTKAIARMSAGMVLCGLSFFTAALVEVWIEACPAAPAPSAAGGYQGNFLELGAMNGTWTTGTTAGMGMRSLLSEGLVSSGESLGGAQQCVNILWQTPQYLVITAAEILFSITGLELAYSQSPSSMSSVVSAAWLVTDAFGNLFTVFVIGSISKYLTHVQEFVFFGTLCVLSMFLLLLAGKNFTYIESCDD